MPEYQKTLSKHRRLTILRHLEGCQDYTSNASILQSVLSGVGIATTRDQVITELSWLKENGMIAYDDKAEFLVAEATQRGVEIAQGLASHPDIQRPGPKI